MSERAELNVRDGTNDRMNEQAADREREREMWERDGE